MKPVTDKIDNVRLIAKTIKYSSTPLERLKELCAQENPPVQFRQVILDVKVRWNSTHLFLEWLLRLKKPLLRLIGEMFENQADSIEDRFDEVSVEEWVHFQWICDLLQPLREATEICSGQNYTTFSSILPLYNVILDHLERSKTYFEATVAFLCDQNAQTRLYVKSFFPERWHGLQPSRANTPSVETLEDLILSCENAMAKMTGYYQVQSDFAIAAVVLDPRLGLEYYRDPSKADQDNKEQMQSAKNEVLHYFQPYSDIQVSSSQSQTASAVSSSKSIGSKIYKKRRVMGGGCQVTGYCDMQKNDVGEDTDVLKWWKNNQSQFPQLAAMARDVFSAVGTSTPSERAFSSSKETITDRRNRLGVKTVEALQLTKGMLKRKRTERK